MNRSIALVNRLGGIDVNLVLNPYFTDDATGWTATNAVLAAVAGELEVAINTGSSIGSASQTFSTRVGRLYRLRFGFKKGTGVSGSVLLGTVLTPDSILDTGALTDAVITVREVYFVATESSTVITLQNNSAVSGETAYFDLVTCSEISNGFGDIMNNCKMNIYSSPMPASPELAATGTLLCVLESDAIGGGMTWEQSVLGNVSKNYDEIWQGETLVNGYAAWFRIYEEGDDPSLDSTTASRIDGTISTANADINVTSVFFLQGSVKKIVYLVYNQPRT